MFENSKKLIDEKVFQQYFFEKFMLATSKERKDYLPNEEYFQSYSKTDVVKGLHPEVEVGNTSKGTKHKTDFVLYPMPSKGLKKLNIELKWDKKEFEKQSERFPYYNGTISKGYVVALNVNDRTEFINSTNIPVVYLDIEDFKHWFSINSYNIITQSLSKKLNISPTRITGKKYWVVNVSNSSYEHYSKEGRINKIWAFRDNASPKNIMKIMESDYIIFTHVKKCEPARMLHPYYSDSNKKFETKKNKNKISSANISWEIDLIDIFRISKGYHLNFTEKKPYDSFNENWLTKLYKLPEEKDYTQFIKFELDKQSYFWNSSKILDRKIFNESNTGLFNFIDSLRMSATNKCDAIEISKLEFDAIQSLLLEI